MHLRRSALQDLKNKLELGIPNGFGSILQVNEKSGEINNFERIAIIFNFMCGANLFPAS